MRLDRDKRYQIKALLSAGLMQKEIAKLLDVKEPTLSREISRNGGRIHYDPEKAHNRATRLAATSHVHYVYDAEDWKIVDAQIKDDLSPEQVNGRLSSDGVGVPCVSTIYRHVKCDKELRSHLRHGKKPYRKRGGNFQAICPLG